MTDYIDLARDLLQQVYDRMTPQVNGMDESCWTIGMHNQVSQQLHDRIRDLLAAHGGKSHD